MKEYKGIVYCWYVYVRPLGKIILSVIFTLLGICILYAEFALFIGIDDSLIYNLLNIVPTSQNTLNYFTSNVRRIK